MTTERLLRKASQSISMAAGAGTLAALFTLTAGVAQAQYTVSDPQLQTSVASALHNDTKLSGAGIQVSTAQGVVTLTGNVPDEAARVEAEQVAAGVSGVKSIQDNIETAGGAASASGPASAPAPPAEAAPAPAPPPPSEGQQSNTAQNMPPAPSGTSGSGMPPPPPADQQQETQYPNGNAPAQGAQNGYPQENAGQYPNQGGNQYPNQGPNQYPNQYPNQGPGPGYPPQNGYGPRGSARPPRSSFGVSPQQQNASGPVSMPAGTLLSVRTSQPLSTNALKGGEYFQVTSAANVYANGVVAIPRGAVLTGIVVEAKNAGPFAGSPKLNLRLTSIQLGTTTYPVDSEVWSSQGPSKTGRTIGNTAGGAVVGALIGAAAGGGVGAGVGAIAGGTGGALISGATHGPRLDLPPEALLEFHLAQPLTVQPVHFDEAERLASSVPEQPVLRQRPVYVAAPYPYAYPYPYARPYPYGYPPY